MANPTQFQSLHEDLGRADAATGYYRMPFVLVTGYIPSFRVFIPPGTLTVTLSIYEWGGQAVRARYKIVPTVLSTTGATDPGSRTLEVLEASDQLIAENAEGKITILDYPNEDMITDSQAGWMYVYVAGGSSNTQIYNNEFMLSVEASVYNAWYDSIDWEVDVESVETYVYGGTDPDPDPEPEEGTITALPTSITFGYTESGTESIPKTITITNGTDAATTVSVTCPDGFEGNWQGGEIASLASQSVNIIFIPEEEKAYSGYFYISNGDITCRVYLSGTATTDLPGDDTDSGRRKSNPNLMYNATGDLCLFYDFVTALKLDGSEITNIYYAISSDHGSNWSTPAAITSIASYGTKAVHPYAARGADGQLTLAYTMQLASLHADPSTYGWCSAGQWCGYTTDLHFDRTTAKLYVYNIYSYSGTKALCSVVVIDTVTWSVEKCYSYESSPGYNAIFANTHVWWHRNQGDGKYAAVGTANGGFYAMAINHDAETITEYYFQSDNVNGITQNIDVDWRGVVGAATVAATQVDEATDRLYILFKHTYAWSGCTLWFGYIDLTETMDPITGKYRWNEIFYTYNMAPESTGVGFNSMEIVKSEDMVILAFDNSGVSYRKGGLWIYSLSSGALIKSYTVDSNNGFPFNGVIYPVYYDGHIYAHFPYQAGYDQADRRGLVDINLSSDSIAYITPTYAAGVNDFALWRKVATGDGRLVISTQGYGIQIFDTLSGSWTSYNADTVPGLTPDGSNVFFDVEYDPATGNIFAAAGNVSTLWKGVVMFSETGDYKQTVYRIGDFTEPGTYGSEANLTQGVLDYEMAVIKDSGDYLWGVWTRKDGSELSSIWDVDESQKEITDYLTGEATLSWDIESANKLSFSVANGHLFDPYNLQSTLAPSLKKGRLILFQLGEMISGVETMQAQGSFIVTEKSMTYRRGEHPIMRVTCEDIRTLWQQSTITATEFYDAANPADVLLDLVTTHGNLNAETQVDLPNDLVGGHTIDHQWIDTKTMDCIKDITDHWGYYPFFDVTGKFTIRQIALTASPAHIYTSANSLIGFSPDDSYGDFVNQVIVKGEGRYFIEVTYAEELMTSDAGTMGWWGCSETKRYYFSDDQKAKARLPRLANIESPSINVLFVEKGGGEVSMSTIDADGYYVEVYIAAPDLILVVVSSIAALVAMAAVAMTCTLECGYYIFACAILTSIVFYLLAAVANYSFDIYARPTGSEKQTFQAEANDYDLQRELATIIKTEIDDPFCYDVANCQLVADREMAVVIAQRSRVTFEKIAHLQDEIGDIIQIVHPYSGQAMNIYITSLSRTYSKPEGSADGGVIDRIEGWWLS